VSSLREGRATFYEPQLDDLIRRNLRAGRLAFTTQFSEGVPDAEFVLLGVGTPPLDDGTADLSHLSAALHAVAPLLANQATVIIRSTVPVGTNRWVAETLQKENPQLTVSVVSNPEFLREGHAVEDFLQPDRIVLGASSEAAGLRATDLYDAIDCPILVVDPETAELIKYAANAYLATSITFINEIANIAERTGGDISLVANALKLDERIGPHAYLAPGIGFGGSCLPKDTRALAKMAEKQEYTPLFLDAIIETNERQSMKVAAYLEDLYGKVEGLNVAVLGISYKGDIFDSRSSPGVAIIQQLAAKGASVRAFDPLADRTIAQQLPENVELCSDAVSAARECHALIIATDHGVFRELDLARIGSSMSARVLIDGRNLFDYETAAKAGFVYIGIGRPRRGE
jgi:UDPglucose 6-dehydrogenase